MPETKPSATSPSSPAGRFDRAFEFAVTAAGMSGIVVLLLMVLFMLREALPLLVDPHVTWRALFAPQHWRDGQPDTWLWQPTSPLPKVSIVPLLVGSLKVTVVAMVVAGPVGVCAAVASSEFAPARLREWLKPVVELLAGVPSVVLGFFALTVLASAFQTLFDWPYRLNAVVAGLALAFAVAPVVFTVSEDALRSVPRSYREASLALGATRWETAWRLVLPAALPGVTSALVLGFGRALGETMIVLMASGNASLVSLNLTDSTRTVSATIAAEMGEAVAGSTHASLLFLLGALLLGWNLVINSTVAAWARGRLIRRGAIVAQGAFK